MKSKSVGRMGPQQRTGALLTGLIFDDRNNRMTPSFTVKRGVRYPFYVSSALLRGRRTDAGSVARVSAPEIEAAIIKVARERTEPNDATGLTPHDLVEKNIARVVVKPKLLVISLKASEGNPPTPIEIPWNTPNKRAPVKIEGNHAESLPSDSNPHLVQAIVRALPGFVC